MESQLIGKSVIIQVDDWPNLEKALKYLRNSKIWDPVETPRGTFLVVINVEKVQATFELLWRYSIHNALVLVKHELKLYQSNPQTVENGCGKSANIVHDQGCEEIQIMFKKGYRKYSGCSTGLRRDPLHKQGSVSKHQLLSSATVDLLINKFQVTVYDDVNGIHRNSFGIAPYLPERPVHHQYSEIVTREKVVIFLPPPNRISPLMIYVSIFQVEVWIMVTCGFFITIFFYAILLAWHGTRITFNNLSLINIQTLSLTLWGSCAAFPKPFSIRFLLVFYIFYSIVVQTGYVSQLIRVLTIPQHEKQVDNLRELADSPILLCVAPLVAFSTTKIHQKLSRNLTYAILDGFKNEPISGIIRTYNCSLAMREDDAMFYLSKERRIPNKILFDPDGGYHFAFVTRNGDYFLDTINHAITSLKENGVYAKNENYVTSEYRNIVTQFSHSDDPQVLTLHHLRGIFIIWAFCLGLSFLVFILEILTHQFIGCYTRRRIRHVEPAVVEPALVDPAAVVEPELHCIDLE